MNLAFVGFGAVPRRFLRLLQTRASALSDTESLAWQVVGIATGHHGMAIDPRGIDATRAIQVGEQDGDFGVLDGLDTLDAPGGATAHSGGGTTNAPRTTQDFLDIVTRLSSDHLVVVENTPLGLDGGHPGVDHVRHALSAGASVITANKGPAAFAFRELDAIARQKGCMFRGEGAALDGLPVFSLVRHTLPGVEVRGFRGIVNTTTNYVLSRMETGQHLDDAVREMREAGITEADPSHDIDGWDAAAKTAVLVNTLMTSHITPHDVARESLRTLRVDKVQQACRNGRRIKVVASAQVANGQIVASARPTTLEHGDRLAALDDTAKGLELDTDLLGRILISKDASGVAHTAYALLCDLVDIRRRRKA